MPLSVPEDIFTALSRLTPHTENQLTESLVYLLRFLLRRHPAEGLTLANRLCRLPEDDGWDSASLAIRTQESTPRGIVDIAFEDARTLAYIEVKHNSPLGVGQLEAYARVLARSGKQRSLLVLLSRSRAWCAQTMLSPADYRVVCWYEVHDWLSALDISDSVTRFLIDGFLEFLERKGMSIDKVTWEYIQGVPAMLRLSQMLEAAITDSLRVGFKRTAGWSWRGFYIPKSLFCGFRYDCHLLIVCEGNNGNAPVGYKRDFDLEAVHFFSLSAGEQLELVTQFITEAYANAPDVAAGASE